MVLVVLAEKIRALLQTTAISTIVWNAFTLAVQMDIHWVTARSTALSSLLLLSLLLAPDGGTKPSSACRKPWYLLLAKQTLVINSDKQPLTAILSVTPTILPSVTWQPQSQLTW
jgi:hypothetical protein